LVLIALLGFSQRWKAQRAVSDNDAATTSPTIRHRIAASHGDTSTAAEDDVTSDLDALSLHASAKRNGDLSSVATQVVLSKKAQRLLKKQAKPKASAPLKSKK
jgi:hypothetical protein